MSSSRSGFFSGTIFGIVLGLVLGHFTLWNHSAKPPLMSLETVPIQETVPNGMSYDLGKKSASLPFYPEVTPPPISDAPLDHELEDAPVVSPLANAIALEAVELQAANLPGDEPAVVEIPTPAEEPKPLEIEDAAPLEVHATGDDGAKRKAIDEELSDIPESQREIWFESLKEMHVDDALGVIRMWKAIGGPIPGLGNESLFEMPGAPSNSGRPTATESHSGNNATSFAFQTAIELHQANLMMESTPGYVRRVPRFHEEVVDGTPRITSVIEEFDFSQGRSLVTGNLLDLMIEGSGFYRVQDQSGQQYLTRRGRFSLNEERQLVLVDPDAEYVLQPVVVIPESYHQLKIDASGNIRAFDESGNAEEVGQVQLSVPTKLHELAYFKNGLITFSSKPLTVPAGMSPFGAVSQGKLALSNVVLNHEKELIRHYQSMLESLHAD